MPPRSRSATRWTSTPGASVAIDVLANDIDDGALDGGSITIVDGPDHGTITGIDPATGVITYAHGGGGGTDSFTYTLTDANGVGLRRRPPSRSTRPSSRCRSTASPTRW